MTMLGKIRGRLSRVWLIRLEAVVTTTELVRAAFPRAADVCPPTITDAACAGQLRLWPVGRSSSGRGLPLLWVGLCSEVANTLTNTTCPPSCSNNGV